MSAIIITPLNEKNGLIKVHINRLSITDIKHLTVSQLRKEIESARQYCKNNNYRLILNYTGDPELPETNKVVN